MPDGVFFYQNKIEGGSIQFDTPVMMKSVWLEDVELIPYPDTKYVALDSATLIGCDLRLMSWTHFYRCDIRRADGDLGPDSRLPKLGEITEARGCRIEIAPGQFHLNS